MTAEELIEKLKEIQNMKCETQTLELKSAFQGCPKRLYDSLSSFSNQDDGGIIIFGIDEKQNYKEVGVYDPQDIQKKINEQCLQMEPVVRPLLTVVEKKGKYFVSAEIPGIDITERPCHYKGQGRLKGSYTRVGDSDEPMTEYEVYSYEAYRKKYQDDIRAISRATFASLNQILLQKYIELLKAGKPNLSMLPDEEIYELMSIKRNNEITLSAVLLFSPYPQAYFPQLSIVAIAVPGKEIGETGEEGERFSDNQRIEGNIPEMLDGAINFVKRNMRSKTIIDPETGKRKDKTDYPLTAVREAIINALVHRDYSIHTEGMPIQIIIYEERMEIHIQDIPKTIAALFLLIFSPSSQVYSFLVTARYIKHFLCSCIITYHYATINIIVFEFLFQNAIIFFFFAKCIAFWYILVAIYLLNQ